MNDLVQKKKKEGDMTIHLLDELARGFDYSQPYSFSRQQLSLEIFFYTKNIYTLSNSYIDQ